MSHVLSVGTRKKNAVKTYETAKHKAVAVKEERAALQHSMQPELSALISQIKKGYSIAAFEHLKEEFGVNREKLADVASISLATLHRRKVSMRRLTPDESEKIYRLQKLYKTAIEVLGNKNSVQMWFGTSQMVFEGKTPLEYADTLPGAEEVERVLRRIEQGVVL